MSESVKSMLEITGTKRFAYDHNTRRFYVAGRTVSVEEAVEQPELLYFTYDDENAEDVPMLTQLLLQPLALPGMYDWIEGSFTDADGKEAVGVMKDVYLSSQSGMHQ